MSLDVSLYEIKKVEVFEANITHNLAKMADAAGIYKACWRPEEINAKKAKEIIPYLELGIKKMEEDPEFFRGLEPPNKWGIYEQFLLWVRQYLKDCRKFPESEIGISR